MDIKSIKQLVEIFEKSSLTMLDAQEGEFKLHLERSALLTAPLPVQAAAVPPIPAAAANEQSVDFNHITEVKSPMVGVFYSAASPDAKPLVVRGSKVKKGDVLCIIEAMKLMNEILAESDGEIVDICVENGQIVEFSQVLFKIF